MKKSVSIEEEQMGNGAVALRGNIVTVKYSVFLNHGDCIQSNIECRFQIGKREVIAGLEYAVEGMKAGGKRKARIGPHLAYKEKGVDNIIPPNAVLIFDIDLIKVENN